MSMPVQGVSPEHILLSHGGGGQMTGRLIAEHVLTRLGNPLLDPLTDSAVLPACDQRTVFTTDSFVVQPLEFPGGDIGRLAVCGTVNDLAVMGARPRALSLVLIIEEGLPIATLDRILASIAAAANEAEIVIATGDTKVIERRHGDGLLINTAGIGTLPDSVDWSPDRINVGDVIIVTGPIADHGMAILSVREGLAFETTIRSDAAPLSGLIASLGAYHDGIRFMRDPTRGGVAGVLADIAEARGLSLAVEEEQLPLSRATRHVAEVFGLDPLTVANEGNCVIFCAANVAAHVVAECRRHPLGRQAAIIGHVIEAQPPLVELITRSGGRRVVQRPYGEELPRIC